MNNFGKWCYKQRSLAESVLQLEQAVTQLKERL